MGITHTVFDKSGPIYKEMQAALAELNGGYIKSGFPDGKDPGPPMKSRAGAKPYDNMGEVARVAAWTEFGTATIPSRPFFRTVIDSSRDKIFDMAAKFADLALIGKLSTDQAFENLGLYMQSIIRGSIRNGGWTANAPRTTKAKHSSRPLIDTGQMINSVTFVKVLRGKAKFSRGSKVVS